jgi:single-strand DNA-binding protein
MSARSLNKVMLIGNLTRDPELRYTPQGTAVCTMGLATNRGWVTDNGDKKEETEFHRIVAWNKLAELCSQLLFKGRRVYVEGRLQTRQWTGQDGNARQATEIVIEDMLVLDSKRQGEEGVEMAPAEEYAQVAPTVVAAEEVAAPVTPADDQTPAPVKTKTKTKTKSADEVAEDIPF